MLQKTYDLIIKNGIAVFDEEVKKADIGVYDGKIVEISEEILGDANEVIDASSLYIFPATTDGHVHFNSPGRMDWETIKNGSQAIAAAGGTSYFDMPLNSSPCTLNRKTFEEKLQIAKNDSLCDFGLWGGFSPNNIDKFEELADCGVIGFKAFACFSGIEEFPGSDDYTFLKGMEQLKKLNLPLMVHCENDELTRRLTEDARKRGKTGVWDYFDAHAPITEIESIARVISFAEETGCKLIIAHISTAKGVELVTEARRRGVNVSCETIGHYLYLTDYDVEHMGTIGKCSPPIRDAANQLKLWGKLFNDEISFVSSDHSPCDPKLKEGEFLNVWGGISACQTTLTGLLTHGYHERKLPLHKIAKLTATNVNEIFGIEGKGRIKVGYDADFTLVDLNREYVLKAEDLFYLHKVSPYVNTKFKGKVVQTILRGTTIYKDGKIVSKPIGRLITPKR